MKGTIYECDNCGRRFAVHHKEGNVPTVWCDCDTFVKAKKEERTDDIISRMEPGGSL